MSEAEPSRRWFRFSLRTMFVVVTLLAVAAAWIGYNLNWIRQRHEMIDSGGVAAGDGPNHTVGTDPVAPGLLQFFREGAYGYIIVFPDRTGGSLTPAEQAKLNRVAQLFPEATVEAHWP